MNRPGWADWGQIREKDAEIDRLKRQLTASSEQHAARVAEVQGQLAAQQQKSQERLAGLNKRIEALGFKSSQLEEYDNLAAHKVRPALATARQNKKLLIKTGAPELVQRMDALALPQARQRQVLKNRELEKQQQQEQQQMVKQTPGEKQEDKGHGKRMGTTEVCVG